MILLGTGAQRASKQSRVGVGAEFLAFASCTRLILIGLLKASVVLHDHNNAACPIPPQAGHSG